MKDFLKNACSDEELQKKIDQWLDWDRNQKTNNEIQALVKKADWTTLRSRLMNRLAFGTAGLRGEMRAGFNSMNDLVVIQTAQGLCAYIMKQFPNADEREKRGIVLGYDGRYNSKRFAKLTAAVFVQQGIKVWLYPRMVPTPFIPFSIANLKCLAGVMVTASHNPKQDNGYKVYWENGAQIIPPHDKNIQESILQNLEPLKSSWNLDVLDDCALLEDPQENMSRSYYDKLYTTIAPKYLRANETSENRIVYTAMHGVGYEYVKASFDSVRLHHLISCKKQQDPDPEFPTVEFPNPEEGANALRLSLQLANEFNASLVLANDPDADRLACAELDQLGEWKIFSGNELGALLGWWCIQNHLELHPGEELDDCYLLASTVSSKILRSMGKVEGFHFDETLTGFKWMGNRAVELMEMGKKVLFAFEEAIGFMITTNVLDKDGVSAACHLATMACYIKEFENLTLAEKLNQIYNKYGYHCTKCSYLFCYDPKTIEKIFQRLRNFDAGRPKTYPSNILEGKYVIKDVRDWSSQMITFTFENDLVVTIRASGTEPKIKYYAELCAQPEEKDWEKVRTTLDTMVDAVVKEFLQPDLNNLQPKKE